ncbi:MAG: autotransporter-associated beta strand repeat-containing protein [Thermoguttaceae bacterium]|nr:autotransporter-associated beta strand repeat-containing protein [Thermoguttaceae bacterium]
MTNSRKPIILSSPSILTCGRILISVLTVFVLTVFVNAQDTVFRYAAGSTESNASGTDITTVQKTSGFALGDVLKLSGNATQNGRLNLESNNGAYLNFTIQSDTPGTMRTIKKTAGSDRFYNFNTTSGTNASITLKDLSIQGSDSEITDAIGLFFHSSTSSTTVNLTVDNVTFSGFKNSGHNGGVIAMDNAGALTITGSGTGKIEFINNYAKTYGGAIHGAETTITGNVVKFTNNTANANHGGAIYSYGGTLAITGQGDNPTIEFSGNRSGDKGGAIYSANSVTFSGDNTSAVFTGNTAATGNDIYINGASGLSFTGSGIYSFDGGIYLNNTGATTVINKAQVTIAGRANDSTNVYQLQNVTVSDGGKLTAKVDYIDTLTGTVNLGETGSTGSIELNAGQGVSKTLSSFTISGAGGLTKTGAGTLELTTANTFTGKTTVSGGTLKLSGSGKLASSVIDVESGSTLTYYNTTPQNTSALTFNVNGGTLEFYNDRTTDVVHNQNNAICSGADNAGVTINGTGGTLLIDGGGHVAVSNGNGSTITISMDKNSTIYVKNGYFMNGGYTSQNWTDNKAALKIGSTGIVNLWDGTQMKVGGLIGDAGAQMIDTQSSGKGISVGNGVTSDQTFTYNGTIDMGKKVFDYVGAGTQVLNGDISNVVMTSKSGTLALGTANNQITLGAGARIISNGGTVRVDGNININSEFVTVKGAWTGNGSITVSSGGELRAETNFSFDKGITLSGGTLRNATDGRTVTVSAPLNLTAESYFKSGWEKNMTLTGSITGAGKFHVKTDSGYVIAATTCTDNSFTGSIHTDNESGSYGLLRLGANNPFGTNAGEARIWGTLDMNGYSQTFAGVANSADTTAGKVKGTSSSVLTLKLNSNASKVYGGSFEGALSLVLTGDGSGTQIFKKAPAYTGSTTVQAGTLQLDAGGTLYNLSGAGTVKFGSKTLTLSNSADTTFSGSLSGSGQISFANNASNWIVMATTCENNSFTGNVLINFSDTDSSLQGKVRLGKDNPFGTSAGQANIYGTLDMNGYSQRFKGLYNNGDKGSIYNNAESLSTLTIDTTDKDLNFQSSITGNIALVITGTGTQTLNKAPEYTGSTTVESGTLKLNAASKLNNLSGAGTVNYGSTSRLTLYNSVTTEFSGHISGSGELVIDNNTYEDGWIVMNTTCDVTGKIRIFYGNASNQGKVRLGRDNAFGLSASEAQIYGTLDMNGHSQTFNGLNNNGDKGKIYNDYANALSTLTINTTGKDLTFQSSIKDNIALVITGTGTQTLKKAPEYTGSTTIESGTLVLSNGGTLYNLSGGSLDDDGNVVATLDASGKALTLSNDQMTKFIGSIKADSIEKTGDGTLQIYTAAAGQVDASSFIVSSGRLDMKEYFKGSMEVEANATMSPGNSVGTLTIDGTYLLDKFGTLLLEVGKDGQGNIVIDQLFVNGNATFEPGSIIDIVLDPSSSLVGGDEFSSVIITANNAESIFNDVKAAIRSYYFTDLTVTRSGNEISLSGRLDANAIPEPSTWALLVLGVAGLMYWRKRIRNA